MYGETIKNCHNFEMNLFFIYKCTLHSFTNCLMHYYIDGNNLFFTKINYDRNKNNKIIYYLSKIIYHRNIPSSYKILKKKYSSFVIFKIYK